MASKGSAPESPPSPGKAVPRVSTGSSSRAWQGEPTRPLDRRKTLTRRCSLLFDPSQLEWVELEGVEEDAESSHQPRDGSEGCLADDVEQAHSKSLDLEGTEHQDTVSFYSLIYVMAVLTCVLSFLNDVVIDFGFRMRSGLLRAVVGRLGASSPLLLEGASMLVWVGYEVVMVAIGHACARTHPMSYGSGIPEIHCELQGTHMKGFLAPGMLRAKGFGLMFAQVGGLPIGKEGPFVHCAAAMTRFLAHLSIFRGALRIPGCLRQLMVVSVAVGTCSTVGVPIGGVLFALEVMPDAVWENISYWMSIGTAMIGGTTLFLLKLLFKNIIVGLVPRFPDEVKDARIFRDPLLENLTLLTLSALLGTICGAMGGTFVLMQVGLQTRLRHWMAGASVWQPGGGHGHRGTSEKSSSTPKIAFSKQHTMMMALEEPLAGQFRIGLWKQATTSNTSPGGSKNTGRRRAMALCLLVALLDGLVSFAVPLVRGSSQPALLWKLVAGEGIDWASVGSGGAVPSLPHDSAFVGLDGFMPLCLFLMVRWVLTVLALSLPLPTGCIIPSYVLGALIGRAFAHGVETLARLASDELHQVLYIYVQFSFIGATAFTCAICHSFSVVVVMFELVNGTEDMLLRLGVAAIVAIYVANLISPSIFQAGAAMKHLPQTPQCRKLLDGWDAVSLAMRTEVACVPEVFGPAPGGSELLEATLNKHPHDSDFVVLAGGPKLDPSAAVLGSVPRAVVERAAIMADERAFGREDLAIATQVAPDMPVKHAQLMLEMLCSSELYVVDRGHLIGAVSFNDIVSCQRRGFPQGRGRRAL